MSDDLPPIDGDDVNETPDETTAPDDDGVDQGTAPVVRDDDETDRVEAVDLNNEMQRSYIEYAMSVIVSRALPDVRDGLKPVHRRIVYAMYDGGYRPDRGYNKCARVVGDVMGHYHPHGDSAIYDALVRLVQDWSLRYPLVDGQGNFGSRGNDGAAAPRYTECRMAPIAMEMVRDIEQNTVDFVPNYDGKTLQPSVLPSRFPNLLVNGSAGIAVGMATQIPPHNLREVAAGAEYYLKHPEIGREELLEHLLTIIKGPDFPTGALIMGHRGIEDAYRTGRGSIIMRAVVNVEEIGNRQALVVTELPYQVNPDMLAMKIADLVKDGKVSGIADINDETSGRTGQRLVITLKRDAVAKVVLNNLYKHTQLQTTFGANMLALVDEVPRTLPLDGFIRHWVDHQIEVIVRRTTFRLNKAEADIHLLRGYLKALDMLDEVIALIRASRTVEIARDGLIELLSIDEVQAAAILNMQLRRLAALEREKIQQDHDALQQMIDEYRAILASPQRQRDIVSEELQAIVDKYGDERRTEIFPFDGDMSMEDLIPEEDVVVTITRGGYAKRTRVDQYRSQKRGGKGVRGASLRGEDVVEHFFTTTTHHWLLFFTNLGRVYRAKAYELPEGSRDSKGQHVANLLAFQPGEQIAQVLAIRDYAAGDYLVLATQAGLVKKTRLSDYDSTSLRRPHRDQPARRRRARRGGTRLQPRRPAARLAQGPVGALHRHRRGAAPDGPLDLGRHRHEVPRRRPPARDVGRRGGREPRRLRRLRERPRQAHPGLGVPPPGPRRPRHPGGQALRQGRRPRRRPDRDRDRRGHGRHGEGQDRALARRRGAPHRPLVAGREVRDARQGRLDRRRGPQRRVGHRGRAGGASWLTPPKASMRTRPACRGVRGWCARYGSRPRWRTVGRDVGTRRASSDGDSGGDE